MTWPAPQLGLVIRYSYLWTREARAGREEGVKDRPCAIVLAIAAAQDRKRVIVVPVTHTPPQPPDEGIELPLAVKTRLGLDHERSWVIVSEGQRLHLARCQRRMNSPQKWRLEIPHFVALGVWS